MERLISRHNITTSFIRDVSRVSEKDNNVYLWWLGQSGFLIKCKDTYLLIDPYLSDSLTAKYQNTSKPHIRMTDLVVSPDELNFIDIVTSSHKHTDHLDSETLIPILNANPKISFIIPESHREYVAHKLGINKSFPVGMNEGVSKNVKDIKITGIAAAHEKLEYDEDQNCLCMGYIFEIDNKKIYHSGDTILFNGLIDILIPHKVDVAILPINGRIPEKDTVGNLNAKEAVLLGKAIGAKLVIPCHYGMFSFNSVDPQGFRSEAVKVDLPNIIPNCGEMVEI